MNQLLIHEPPLQVLPSLAMQVGLNEAIVLQQLHFRSLISTKERDGCRWVLRTYEDWKEKEFPFWSVNTIRRAISNLEEGGYIISTDSYNKMKMDKTKWYRVNYETLISRSAQNEQMVCSKRADGSAQNEQCDLPKMDKAITKEFKSIKKYKVENDLDAISAVIDYLNEKANKSFKANSKASRRFINARLEEGYTLDDFKAVIDTKTSQWLNDQFWNAYLRPSTLFSPKNFENYLNENQTTRSQRAASCQPKQPQLDFGRGEES